MIGRPLTPMSVAGVRRRGRRRGLIAGAAVGASMANRNNSEPEPVAQAPVGVSQDDKIAQLEKLAGLKQQGILSEAEFEQQKAQILSA